MFFFKITDHVDCSVCLQNANTTWNIVWHLFRLKVLVQLQRNINDTKAEA